MKKRNLIYAFLLVLMAFAVSCKKDTEVNMDSFKVENEKVTSMTQSVLISGTYAYSGTIDGITLELGRQTDLMDGDAYRTLIDGTNFSVEVKNLRTNTTYYYRYAVEYGGKSPYRTEIKTFKTVEYKLPEVASKEVVSVAVNRAEVSGEVLSDGGGDAVTLRGICWSTGHNPSVGDEYANACEGLGTFTCELTNLQPEKTYYARAFAGNSKGVSYGEELTFVTLAAGSLAEVSTLGITGNAMLQATVSGEVTNEGTSSVLERGVCYGKEHYPTTSGLHVSAGTGAGEFSCQLTNLEANTTYYVRAYAINSLGISYGDEMSFVAQSETTVPVVQTGMVSDITVSSATGHGTVVSDGGVTVTRRGLCWSVDHNPTADGTHADCGNGVGEFSGLMPHLEDLTTYYVRAYAENSLGIAYGEEVSFTVGQHEHPVPPTVITAEVTNISLTTAVGGGNVINDGGAEVTERGICWSTDHNPTMDGNHATNGSGTGEYSVDMTELTVNTTYYVRAYAINSVGVSYGEEVDFITSDLPQYTIDVSASPSNGGTVSGGGTYQQGQSCMVTATSNYGYTFTNWTEDGGVVSSDASYTFTVTEDRNLVAHFELNNYTISVSANPSEGGVVNGGGTYQHGQSCTVTATANSDYSFTNWTENGNVVSTDASYTFIVTSNRILEANFIVSASGDTFSVDFEDGMPAGWTTIDADGDGYNWMLGSVAFQGQSLGHNASTDFACSASYENTYGALYPDNYLVSPQVTLGSGSTFSFYACAQDASYSAEHFGVAVSTTGTSPSDFTIIQEWTMTAKGGGMPTIHTRSGNRVQGNWYQYTVDLSAYAGQQVYIAIRHFNCNDWFYLDVDDVMLSNAKK